MQRTVTLSLAILLSCTAIAFAQNPSAAAKPRVFLESQSKGGNRNAARDQSMEMSKDFEEVCPEVQVTINQQMADYTVLLNHIEVGLFVRDNQFQLANHNGDLISRTREGGRIRGGVKKMCRLILDNWMQTESRAAASAPPAPAAAPVAEAPRAEAPAPAPAEAAQEAPAPTPSAQFAISSTPADADIDIDGGFVGNTPSSVDLPAGEHVVQIHKDGFKDWKRTVKVSGGNITLRANLEAIAK
jgi:pyruvate/2-oxoglutarate dehydrogenase complex dihydrolipoamide acyltransferase (E2) component